MSDKKSPYGKLCTLIYATILGDLQQIARDNGYSLAVHGSMQRDFDLIAVPWTEEACDDAELIRQFILSLKIGPGKIGAYEEKPHGRIAYFLILDCGMGLDISIMPIQKKQERR